MKIGDVFYINDPYALARDGSDEYAEITIVGEDDRFWLCSRGQINKRSTKYREMKSYSPVSIYTKAEVELREYDRKHRYKISNAIACRTKVNTDMLKKVAELIGYKEDGE